MLIRLGIVTTLLLSSASMVFAQTPDPRDSVIIEEKFVPVGFTGNPAFVVQVYIKNKDSLAGFVLPLKFRTSVGSAFVVLDTPRTFDGTIIRRTSTLGNNSVFSDFTDGASPDSALWSSSWDPNNRTTVERPNTFRKTFWEIRFSRACGSGDVTITRARIFDKRVCFVSVNGDTIPVNFRLGILHMSDDINIINCPPAGGIVLYGRQYSYDFNTDVDPGATWSLGFGPGSIDPNGIYTFSGQCPLGVIPVNARASSQCGSVVQCDFTVNVIDNPPVCSPAQSTITVSHGLAVANQINASDPDAGDGVVFSVLSGPGSVNSSGVWSYTTGCGDVGASPQTIKIKVADAFGSCNPGPKADTCQFQLVVTNSPPVFIWPAATNKPK